LLYIHSLCIGNACAFRLGAAADDFDAFWFCDLCVLCAATMPVFAGPLPGDGFCALAFNCFVAVFLTAVLFSEFVWFWAFFGDAVFLLAVWGPSK
jgi:hypothetical protein